MNMVSLLQSFAFNQPAHSAGEQALWVCLGVFQIAPSPGVCSIRLLVLTFSLANFLKVEDPLFPDNKLPKHTGTDAIFLSFPTSHGKKKCEALKL